MNKMKCTRVIGPLGVLLGMLMICNVNAQEPITVSLSNEVAASGDAVAVSFSFTGNGESRGFDGDFTFDDTMIIGADFSDCLEGSNQNIGQCNFVAGSTDTVRISIATLDPSLTDFTGTIVFQLADPIADGTIVPLQWDPESLGGTQPDADVISTDGSITVAEMVGACSLSITPASHDFGPVQVNSTASQSFTISNTGDGDCTGLMVDVSGDAAFSLAGSDCGATLAEGASCSADVNFSPAAVGNFVGSLDADAVEDSASAALSGEGTEQPIIDSVAIPTMQVWGLALMALMMLMIGVFSVRTFRS